MTTVRTLSLALIIPVLAAGLLRAESNDRPYRPAEGLCTQLTIDVTNDAFTYEGGVIHSSGSWTVKGAPAKGVLLEYRLDSDRYQAETQTGVSGKWTYTETFKDCGYHVLETVAFPAVIEKGRTSYCLTLGKTVKAFFHSACQTMTSKLDCTGWTCKDGSCTGTCTGDAEGGEWGYVALFGINDANYMNLPSSQKGPWSSTITCAPGQRVSFKVRDKLGAGGFSPVSEKPCGK
jgi:hypothetical protein